jgi:tRNA U34 2-thiouridine synthase MnmA/TrmU
MLKKAKNYMQKLDCKFVFTGEVLGQRPKSQKKDYLKIIERDSGLENLILRPLSAKLLAPTIPERKGFVNREKLLALRGRSRKEQMRLAENFSLDYPCPAGGCRLTQKEFAKKLKDAFRHEENTLQDMIILRYGRHFRLNSHAKVIVGRNDLENKVLEKLAGKKDLILEVVGYGSPITLLRSSLKEEDILLAGALCARYSDARTLPKVKVRVSSKEKENLRYLIVTPLEEAKVKKFRVT